MHSPRNIVVTGATGGIGTAIVDRFLRSGDRVLATGLDSPSIEKWQQQFDNEPSISDRLSTVVTDIADEDSVNRLATAAAALGEIHVLINNAGTFVTTPFTQLNLSEWRRVLDIDLTGTFLVIKALHPLMDRTGRGRIISIGSGTLYDGTPGMSHYAAAKGGVLGLTRVLAREFGADGITVNLLTPGLTRTDAAVAAVPDALWAEQREARAIGRDEVPADIAGAAFFLASEDSAFLTGQVLNVDGGSKFL